MHNAPAVNFPVGRSRFYGAVLAGVLALSASTLVLWAAQADVLVFRHRAAALLWLISSAWAVMAWWHSSVGVLHWDGQAWTWRCGDEGCNVDVSVVLDGQGVLLLRLSTTRQLIWVWPEQRMEPLHWLALRRAVFAPKRSATRQDVGVAS